MEGWLWQQESTQKRRSFKVLPPAAPQWNQRYWILTGQRLRCYDSPPPAELLEDYDLSRGCKLHSVPSLLSEKHRPHSFVLTPESGRHLYLAAPDAALHSKWLTCCETAIGNTGRSRTKPPPGRSTTTTNHHPPLSPCLSPLIHQAAVESQDETIKVVISTTQELVNLKSKANKTTSTTVFVTQENSIPTVQGGSVLIKVNEQSVTKVASVSEIKEKYLKTSLLPLNLTFIRPPLRSGVLKLMPQSGIRNLLCQMNDTMQWSNSSSAKSTGSSFDTWKQQQWLLDGDSFKRISKSSTITGKLKRRIWKSSKSYCVIPLSECSIKLVHRVIAGRDRCFLLTSPTQHMLFQANDSQELLEWMGALTHAIDLLNGRFTKKEEVRSSRSSSFNRLSASYSQDLLLSSLDINPPHLRRHELVSPKKVEKRHRSFSDERVGGSSSTIHEMEMLSLSETTALSVVKQLEVLQHQNRMTDAIQLLKQNLLSVSRSDYWPLIFAWALLDNNSASTTTTSTVSKMDAEQIGKDVPRTSQWLHNTIGVVPKQSEEMKIRLEAIEKVLLAYVSEQGNDGSAHYIQGMNGIAFVLLEALDDDNSVGLKYLRGILRHVLNDVYYQESSSYNVGSVDDDTLVATGQLFESIVSHYLPQVSLIFEAVGLPVFILVYKWFPTLFSDVSLTQEAESTQLSWSTLMAAWDVCLLLGIEGVLCVALAILSAAQPAILALPSTCLAEDVGKVLNETVEKLSPEWLLDGVCVILKTCFDRRFQKMRLRHLTKLRKVRERQ